MWLRILFLCSCTLLSHLSFAGERPKIGLVLSGGGAKGAAHIGVLKVLEANHIPVDYIAGTSIGAYVGGMYALGYSADEIEAIMMKTDWAEGYSDTIPRQQLSYRDKQFRDQFNIPFKVGYSDGEVKTPKGLLQGQTMSQLLLDSTNLVHQFGCFDQLAIPYRAVATNLVTSEAVVLDSGSIVAAMQASATVPGALQPAQINGKLLVDGGIANNMPVDVVKAMGADIVIAVDIGSPLMDKSQLDGTVAVLNQLSTFLTNASTERQKKLLTDTDILIRPAIDDLSTTDFSIMAKALPLGIEAANKQLKKLVQLDVGEVEYQAYVTNKHQLSKQWTNDIDRPLIAINYDNLSKVNKSLIKETLGLNIGEVVDKKTLDAAVDRVYALNKFERVDTRFVDTPNGRELTIVTRGKSWGPNYFNLGFSWEDDFSVESAIALDFAYTLTDLTDTGGEWRNEVALGNDKRMMTEFYQPLDMDQIFFSKANLEYTVDNWNIYSDSGRITQFDRTATKLDLGLGWNFIQQGFMELGVTGELGYIENENIPASADFNSYGAYIKFGYDSLDSISFPTQGNRVTIQVYLRNEDLSHRFDADHFSVQVEGDWKGALSIGNHAFVGKASFATVSKDGEFTIHQSDLGGFLNLSGFHKNSLVGAHKVFGAFIYQYDLGRDALGMTDYPLYLGSSIEAGNVWDLKQNVKFNDLIYAGSLYVGTDTSMGPAALGFGVSDKGEKAFYLFIGKNF
ncbi:patatin-like phospholipase family protein [Shewanella marina]|uniref:patatin-like phospholipase family protein n=1 Tax=Shewanella marina TaxID=487319 RepID=UPI000472CD96|nr:patatin-like phospholipase family protein [Shewanella marina]